MATPGPKDIIIYKDSTHDIIFQFQDSDGNDFDISGYNDFSLNIYKLTELTVHTSIQMDRTGSELSTNLTISDIADLPENAR